MKFMRATMEQATEEGLDVFFEISRYSTIVLTIEVFQVHL
jgi:hypothetical protein